MVNTVKIARNTEYEAIADVVTVREAAIIFHLDPSTIRRHIESDYIAARKIGDIWICSYSSLKRLYPEAKPLNPLVLDAYKTD